MTEEPTLQPSQPFTITVKKDCETCEKNLEEIQTFMDNKPLKYGNKLTLTLHQDFWGGNVWHIDAVEIGNYERDRLEADLERAKESGDPRRIHSIQNCIINLRW